MKWEQDKNEGQSLSSKTRNAEIGPAEFRTLCHLDATGENLMRTAMRQLQISARAYNRILKLARTIADLTVSEQIEPNHIAEALKYRPKLMADG